MLSDSTVTIAVPKVLQRAERQENSQKLVAAYVDSGILPQLLNHNNQIVYGRRGTGKTHVLRVLGSKFESQSECVAYIDCRTLGSSAQFADADLPLGRRCLALFRDLLSATYNELLKTIVERQPRGGTKALECADLFLNAITAPSQTLETKEFEVETDTTETSKFGGSGNLSIAKGNFSVQGSAEQGSTHGEKFRKKVEVKTEDKILFPSVHQFLTDCLEAGDFRLVILLDEWSSLPVDIQPYLAEFLKRGILPVQKATLKIAALEQRSSFSIMKGSDRVGFELGADIAASQDLDDSYVYDRNPESITDFYCDVLYRHLQLELPENYLQDNHRIKRPQDLASRMFTERSTFMELGRAAEGVIRDLIHVFSQAYFQAQKRGKTTIDKQAVIEGSRQWFEQDKSQGLDSEMQNVLRKIVDEVIGKRKARSFLVPRELEKHPMIIRLFDARVIHHIQRGYADKDNPGVRYNIYSLDYGTYVDLLGTSKEPQIDFAEFDGTVTPDIIVPFDDKRSIRRIVLREQDLIP